MPFGEADEHLRVTAGDVEDSDSWTQIEDALQREDSLLGDGIAVCVIAVGDVVVEPVIH